MSSAEQASDDTAFKQRRFLESIIDGLGEGFAAIDHEGKQVIVNKKLCEMTGFQKDELIGCYPPYKYWADEGIEDIDNAFAQTLKGVLKEWKLLFKRKNGERFTASVLPVKLIDPNGSTIFIATVKDITVKQRAEEALKESEEKYRGIVETSPNFVMIYQKDVVKYVNKAMCKRLSWTFEEMTSPSFSLVEKIIPRRFQRMMKEDITKRLDGQSIPPYEINVKTRGGEEIPVIVNAQKILYRGKPAVQYILIDITERKQDELKKLAVTNHIARSIGHELRKPFTAIVSATYTLKDEVSEEGKKILELIERNISEADKIISNLVNFTVETKLSLREANINSLIQETLSQTTIPKNVKYTTSLGDNSKAKVDVEQFKRALLNLLTNSLQSMSRGGELSISTDRTDDFVRIKIRDTGIGISRNDLEKIFTPFFSTKTKGTRLGFVNAKKVIEDHSGTIQIESEVKRGTIVTITIPAKSDS